METVLDKINKIIIQWPSNGFSGTVFLETIFDFHKNLLTFPLHYLADYSYIYDTCLKNTHINEVFYKLQNSNDTYIMKFFNSVFKEKIDPDLFISKLKNIFPIDNYIPSKLEYFKAIFLAYNECLGRNCDNVKTIYISLHPFCKPTPVTRLYDIFDSFEYNKGISIVRRPSIALASLFDREIYSNQYEQKSYSAEINNFCNRLKNMVGEFNENKASYIMPPFCHQNSKYFNTKCIVRFEDLKENPLDILQKICNFLELEFDDILLKTTCNGRPYTMKVRGETSAITNYDKKNIHDFHSSAFSDFDHFRIELLTSELYKMYQYQPIFFSNNHHFSNNDILKLFEIKFKFEDFFIRDESQKTILKIRQQLIDTVKFIIEKNPLVNSRGEILNMYHLIQ